MLLHPIIIKSGLILSLLSWLNGFTVDGFEGIFPFIFVKDPANVITVRHETIHFYQQLEVGIIYYYPIYGACYLYNRIKGMDHEDAYYNVPFETEAYNNEDDEQYLENRRYYEWLRN